MGWKLVMSAAQIFALQHLGRPVVNLDSLLSESAPVPTGNHEEIVPATKIFRHTGLIRLYKCCKDGDSRHSLFK